MNKEAYYLENITDYQPLGDGVLITANVIVTESDDILDTGEKTFNLKYLQQVEAVGDAVSDSINVGDIVDIDTEALIKGGTPEHIQKFIVIMNKDTENPRLLVPSRYIRGVVNVTEEEEGEV